MNIKIIKSCRKTIAIEIKTDMQVLVRVPNRMKSSEIQRFIEEKTPWIEEHLKIMAKRLEEKAQKEPVQKFTNEQISEMAKKALEDIPKRCAFYAEKIGVKYNRITIRNQVSRWGSCSGKGNLNFNCLLMLCPEEIRDYVVIHELCHLIELNHSPKFWDKVSLFCPDYKIHRKWLKENGHELIERL